MTQKTLHKINVQPYNLLLRSLAVKSDIWGIWLHFTHKLHEKQSRVFDSCSLRRKAEGDKSHGYLQPQRSRLCCRQRHFPDSSPNGEQKEFFLNVLKIFEVSTWREGNNRDLGGSGCIFFSLQMWLTEVQKPWLQLNMRFWESQSVSLCFVFLSSVVNLLQKKIVWVPRLYEQSLKSTLSSILCPSWWHLSASHGLVCVLCVCGEKVPASAQSVLTCVTCASAVWLVDWMNIGWVSSCPAGIVTCWIWYNCCKTERQTEGEHLCGAGYWWDHIQLYGFRQALSCYQVLFKLY